MIMKKFFIIALLMFVCFSLSAQQSYYSTIEGVKGGETLKNALHKLIDKKSTVDYGSGTTRTWGAFYTTDFIMEDVKQKVESIDGIGAVTINLVFEPEWDKDMMSDEAKVELGFL